MTLTKQNALTEEQLETQMHRAFAAVGQLVLGATALDQQLNKVVISVMVLKNTTMLEPVIATLESGRKIEMLKARADHFKAPHWAKPLKKYLKKLESLNAKRNIVAHFQFVPNANGGSFRPPSVAKILKAIDLPAKSIKQITLDEIENTTADVHEIFRLGEILITNFDRVSEALLSKSDVKSSDEAKALAETKFRNEAQ